MNEPVIESLKASKISDDNELNEFAINSESNMMVMNKLLSNSSSSTNSSNLSSANLNHQISPTNLISLNTSNINNSSNETKKKKRVQNFIQRNPIHHGYLSSGIGKASFVHALVVIFLEFFAWGLLTDQVITVLNETFPNSTFLANGLIHGLKGILSFLSAPLIGALSDVWGRKVFLLITVFFTCLPIPLMRINSMWYFAMISISGLFAVTFSVVFAYVADVTDESNRTTTYGLVSATFAASLITSPALGTYLSRFYSENFVIALATAIAVFDLFFILVAVPESLPEKLRERSKSITWENVDPFKSLKAIFKDRTIMLLCITVFLSYLPEAGQYSCFFVYLKLIVGFTQNQVAYFIAFVGILSCIAQAAILIILIKYFGSRQSIIIGLSFQVLQLALYAFAAQDWLIWFSGLLAALSSIGYPAISAYISNHSHVDQQGVSQGMVTGIRGLCNGIGPALYGFIFWIFRVNLNESSNNNQQSNNPALTPDGQKITYASTHILPGPPFLFGSILALVAIFVTWLIPSNYKPVSILLPSSSSSSNYTRNPPKEKTVVKIGNTSTTYNRTLSSSSLTNEIKPNTTNHHTAQYDHQISSTNSNNNYLLNDFLKSSNKKLNDLEIDNIDDDEQETQSLLNNLNHDQFNINDNYNPNNLTKSLNFNNSNKKVINNLNNLNSNVSNSNSQLIMNTIGGIINSSYNSSSNFETLNSSNKKLLTMTNSSGLNSNSNETIQPTNNTSFLASNLLPTNLFQKQINQKTNLD